MKRSRLYRFNQKAIKRNALTYRRNSLLAAGVLGILFGLIVSPIVYKWLNPPMLDPQGSTIEVGAVEITPTPKKLNWNDAIREVFPADEAGKMIRICMTENKGQNPYAKNYNKNGTVDASWCQVNSVHKPKNMSLSDWLENLADPKFHAKQVRKIYLSQGWNAWVVYNKGLVK